MALTGYPCKMIYKLLLKEKITITYMQAYWEAALADQVNIMWSNVWQRQTIKLSPDRKLAEFNFKILHGILPNMSNLHKWKLVPTPLCALCLVREDTEHMFVSCRCVSGLCLPSPLGVF